jgi:hypothetical protein
MPLSGAMRAQIGTLIVATSAIQLGNGFFGTFISLRVSIEHFGATLAGLVLSSYFRQLYAIRNGRVRRVRVTLPVGPGPRKAVQGVPARVFSSSKLWPGLPRGLLPQS